MKVRPGYMGAVRLHRQTGEEDILHAHSFPCYQYPPPPPPIGTGRWHPPPFHHHRHGGSVGVPKYCVLQMSNGAMGGFFINIISFTLPVPSSSSREDGNGKNRRWNEFGGFITNRSKSWRILVRSYYHHGTTTTTTTTTMAGMPDNDPPLFVGLEVKLMDPAIASENLQKLHALHNATLVLSSIASLASLAG